MFYGSVLRADINSIRIGKGTNVQDKCIFHVSSKYPVIVGDYVTIGHGVIVHACEIKDYTLLGMGSILMDGCVVGKVTNCFSS